MYFQNFPKIPYDSVGDGELKGVTNLLRRVGIRAKVKAKINIGTSNTDYPTATAITNYEHEQELQDTKRKIRLLDPSYISDFVEEFKSIIRESVI